MRRIVIIILSIVGLISLDYISKQYAVGSLATGDISLFGDWIGLRLSYNPGIAFSLPITGLPLQIITIGLVLALLGYYFHTEYPKKSKLLDAGYILIIAGALSHAYERIAVGYVIDFISVKYFAILNFADIFISIGALLLFVVYYCNNTDNDLKNSAKI
jgi:signal peptidase II